MSIDAEIQNIVEETIDKEELKKFVLDKLSSKFKSEEFKQLALKTVDSYVEDYMNELFEYDDELVTFVGNRIREVIKISFTEGFDNMIRKPKEEECDDIE